MKRLWLHPFPLRTWHWLNTALVLLLMVTGIQLRAPGVEIFSGYRTAVVVHKATGFVMVASFVFWLAYTLVSRRARKHYVICLSDLTGLVKQGQYYAFGVFREMEKPLSRDDRGEIQPSSKDLLHFDSVHFYAHHRGDRHILQQYPVFQRGDKKHRRHQDPRRDPRRRCVRLCRLPLRARLHGNRRENAPCPHQGDVYGVRGRDLS